jgi:flagellar motor switch protein FliG
MPTLTPTLRKAAVLIRSLDADTAAAVLSRLSPAEAKAVRLAIHSLGEIDDDERADVSAEFRRTGAVAQEDPRHGVELDLSSSFSSSTPMQSLASSRPIIRSTPRPFEFLEQARVEALVPYLAREHAQTVAVVLSYLAPARAAQVLAALPEKLQSEAIDRLSILGDTDPSSLEVLERELAEWVSRQQATRTRPTQRIDTVAAILAAADMSARNEILGNLVKHNPDLARQVAPAKAKPELRTKPVAASISDAGLPLTAFKPTPPAPEPAPIPIPVAARIPEPVLPTLHMDDLTRFDAAALNAVLKSVDAELLTLALVGASDALVDRITAPMPPRVAKAFRQRLHNTGPTRLRDVEAAQHEVAAVAAKIIFARHSNLHA